MAARRQEWFAAHPCVVCGATENLELHHRDRDQKVDHKIWSWSESRRLIEMEKCDSLCHVHHNEATARQFNYYSAPHGTHHRYAKFGCRCRACTDAHAEMNRKYRQVTKYNRTKAATLQSDGAAMPPGPPRCIDVTNRTRPLILCTPVGLT
jgi:hypothetical protein